jgi:hypothetical protein
LEAKVVGGGAYAASYWMDISGDAKYYRKAHQDSLKKINFIIQLKH